MKTIELESLQIQTGNRPSFMTRAKATTIPLKDNVTKAGVSVFAVRMTESEDKEKNGTNGAIISRRFFLRLKEKRL